MREGRGAAARPGVLRRPLHGQHDRHGPEDHDEHRHPEAEHGPVEGDSGVWIVGTHRAQRCQWGQRHGDADGHQRAHHDGAHDPEQRVARCHERVGTEGAQGALLRSPETQLPADHLTRYEDRSEPGDEAEHGEGDGLGLNGVLGLGDVDGGVVEVVGEFGGHDPLELRFDRRHVAAPLVELQVGERVVRTAVVQPPREGRREDDGRRAVGIDLVLYDGVVEDNRADEGEPLVQRRRCVRRRLELGVGVGAPGDGLPDVEVQGVGGTHGHHDLVGPLGVGHPSLQDRDPVLVEGEPVDASVDVEVGLLRRRRRLPVRSDRLAVDGGVTLGSSDMGQAGDGGYEGGVIAGGVAERRIPQRRAEAQVGRVGTGQEGGEGGLGAPGGGQGAHGEAANHPDQQDN